MPNYTPYPTVKTTPARKARKAARRKIFEENKLKAREERRQKAENA